MVDSLLGEFLAKAASGDAFFEEAVFDEPSGELLVVEVVFGYELGDDLVDVSVGVVGMVLEVFFAEVVASFFDGVRAG